MQANIVNYYSYNTKILLHSYNFEIKLNNFKLSQILLVLKSQVGKHHISTTCGDFFSPTQVKHYRTHMRLKKQFIHNMLSY